MKYDLALFRQLNDEYRDKRLVTKPPAYDPASVADRGRKRAAALAAKHEIAGRRVLEIGCGRGEVSRALAENHGCEAVGVDMLFLTGVHTRAELDTVAAAVKLPLFLGGAGTELHSLDYLSARNVRICLQTHAPFMASVRAAYETLKALRDGVPPHDLPNLPSADLMKRVTRHDDYAGWIKDFLGGAK